MGATISWRYLKYRKFHDVLIGDLRGFKYSRGEFIRASITI